MLFSRRCLELEQLVGGVPVGQGGSLVVRGEAGVGKTMLLGQASAMAPMCRVIRVGGVETEKDLAFAAIHQLCWHVTDDLGRLPDPQADALRAAFGLTASGPPDYFLVGLAVRSLLAQAAEQQPLLCVVDDAQWLDGPSARTLAFVGRRLEGLPVGLICAVRERRDELAGLSDVELKGLSTLEARALIEQMIPGPMDAEVRSRLVAETEGHPVAFAGMLRLVRPATMAGGFGNPGAIPLPAPAERTFRARLEQLPEDTRRLLVLTAAEPRGRPGLLKRAADRLGIPMRAAVCAEAEGLLRLGSVVRFPHPGMRSAVYRAASPAERLRVHGALADATDPELDPDQRAWHRGYATAVPDEGVAMELEQAAGRVQAKGGLPAAAALLDRAAALTPEPVRRSQRSLAAGQAKVAAGALDEAVDLLVRAESRLLARGDGARLEQLLTEVDVAQLEKGDAATMLLRVAKRLAPTDVPLARDTYMQALVAAFHAGHLSGDTGIAEVALQARAALPSPQLPAALDLLLDGLVALFTDGYAVSVPVLQQALRSFEGERGTRWLLHGAGVAAALWDDAGVLSLAARQRELALANGALTTLQHSLLSLAPFSVYAGNFVAAADLIEQAAVITDPPFPSHRADAQMMLAAFRGREGEATHVLAAAIEDANIRGEGRAIAVAEEMTAVLHNGLGNYRRALAAAQQAAERGQPGVSDRALAELVEAAVRCGERQVAEDALRTLTERTTAFGTDWALGVGAFCRALLSEAPVADGMYRTAIDRLGRCSITTALARAHLLYGEWLRRGGRRIEARQQLRQAMEMFTAMGAEAFAERAERELLATGERLHRRGVEAETELTSKEAQISQLARDGLSNPEIAAKLYISPRTVEYHLGKVFRKLGISSRNELHRVALHHDGALMTL